MTIVETQDTDNSEKESLIQDNLLEFCDSAHNIKEYILVGDYDILLKYKNISFDIILAPSHKNFIIAICDNKLLFEHLKKHCNHFDLNRINPGKMFGGICYHGEHAHFLYKILESKNIEIIN